MTVTRRKMSVRDFRVVDGVVVASTKKSAVAQTITSVFIDLAARQRNLL